MSGIFSNFLLGAAGVGDLVDHALGGTSTLAATVAADQGTGTEESNATAENAGTVLPAAVDQTTTDVGTDAGNVAAAIAKTGTQAAKTAAPAIKSLSTQLFALLKSLWWLVALIVFGLVFYVLTITGGWAAIASLLHRRKKS